MGGEVLHARHGHNPDRTPGCGQGGRSVHGDGYLATRPNQHDLRGTLWIGQDIATTGYSSVVVGTGKHGHVLTCQEQCGRPTAVDDGAPSTGGLVGVGWSDDPELGNGSQRGSVLDGLVGRPVLAHAHRVVAPDEDVPGARQGS